MKKIVIVGGSGGLGTELIAQFSKQKVSIVNISRTKTLNCINIKTDLSVESDVTDCIDNIRKNHSDLDVLILAPGVLHWDNLGSIPDDSLDFDFEVNIKSSIKIVNGLINLLKENKGDIVVIGSTSSFKAFPGCTVYTSAKHAVLGLIASLQAELKKEPVRVIGFHPGGFKSNLHIKAKSDINIDSLMEPSDLAKLLVSILNLPRNMEVSEIIINRRKV